MNIQPKFKLISKTTSSVAQVPAQLPTDSEGVTKSFNSSTGEKPSMDSLPFSKSSMSTDFAINSSRYEKYDYI